MHFLKSVLLPYILLTQTTYIFAQKAVLIVDTAMGFNDLEDIPNNAFNSYLPYSIDDFTVAAADTNPSYAGFLMGKLQLDSVPIISLNNINMHSVASKFNINTAHFGAWNFTSLPDTQTKYITNDPELAIDNALDFIKNKDNYLITIFMPPLSDMYISNNHPLRNNPLYSSTVLCYDKTLQSSKTCPRAPYVEMLRSKDLLLQKLFQGLSNEKAFVAWAPVHGGIDPHLHALSAPKTSLRGAQYSLYDGGIRVKFRYTSPDASHIINNGNAIDIPVTMLSLFNLDIPKADGINLFVQNQSRSISLRWRTNSKAEGNCINTSPMFAEKIRINDKDYKILYDANPKNDQIYAWNSGFEFQTAQISYPIATRPVGTLQGCKATAISGVKFNPAKKSPLQGIIFVMMDDIGYGDIRYFANIGKGRNYPDTPNLDNLAKQNLVLTDFHSAATICTPTRYAALTGRHPSNKFNPIRQVYEHTVNGLLTGARPPYLGAIGSRYFSNTFFKSKGWSIGHFGKMHISSPRSKITPEFYGIDKDGYKCHSCYAPPSKTYPMTVPFYEQFSAQVITNDSLAWLDQQKSLNKNFFLNIWYSNMHTPFMATQEQLSPLGFGNEQNPYLISKSTLFTKLTPLQVYNGLFKYFDNEVGRILTWLKVNDYDEKVLFVFHADNGPEEQALGENSVGDQGPYRGRKRSNYEGGHRIPAILKWGDSLSGSTNVLSATYDLFPTFVSLAGYDVKQIPGYQSLDGMDLSPCILYGQCDQFQSRVLRWESVWPNRGDCLGIAPRFAVRWKNYTCLADSVSKSALLNMKLSPVECYDLDKDILQSNNLAKQNPALAQEFRQLLNAWPNYDTKYWPKKVAPHTGSYTSNRIRNGFKC